MFRFTQVGALLTSIILCNVLADDSIVDLSAPDTLAFQSFEYHYDDVPTRMIVPKSGTSITSIREGSVILWTAKEGEECFLLTLRLRNGLPVLMHISVFKDKNSVVHLYRKNGVWRSDLVDTEAKSNEAFFKLKHAPKQKKKFSLDFSQKTETDQFDVIAFNLLRIPTRIHIPRLGHYAMEVRYRGSYLWKAVKEDEHCIAVAAHLKNMEPTIVHIMISDGKRTRIEYRERKGFCWIELAISKFDRKVDELFSNPNDAKAGCSYENTSFSDDANTRM